jgi:hypothetical protein
VIVSRRLFIILDLPLLLPDANGTGKCKAAQGQQPHSQKHTGNVNGGEWKEVFHLSSSGCKGGVVGRGP